MSGMHDIAISDAVIQTRIQAVAANDSVICGLLSDDDGIIKLRRTLKAMDLSDFKSTYQCAGSVAFLRGDKPVILRMNTGDGKSLIWHLGLHHKPTGFVVIVTSPLISLNFDQFTLAMTRLRMTTENVVYLDSKTSREERARLYERLRTHDPALHVVFASTAMIETNRHFQDALLCANKFAFVSTLNTF
jgi:superfamily II DNA helicase RecQ